MDRSRALHAVFADYDEAIRRADGRVDVPKMMSRLKELGVNTYFWLVWSAPTDWDDLKLFLPQAAKAGIRVWVYLAPPSENGPAHGGRYAEPYRLDYLRWADAIARLSLEYPNLTAWVMDDFAANSSLFTPKYVREMQSRAKRINPRLDFLPLMYYPEFTRRWVEAYGPVIDGVVAAYPQNRKDIQDAWAFLNSRPMTWPDEISFPKETVSHPGDFGAISQEANVRRSHRCLLRFGERDDYTGPTSGYHYKQVLVDGQVVWQQDVAGGLADWKPVLVDVTRAVQDKRKVAITFRLWDEKGVANFAVRWQVKDVRAQGLAFRAGLTHPKRWDATQHGPFVVHIGKALKRRPPRYHIPLIVMTAAQSSEFRSRHGDPATPQRMAAWLRMSLQAYAEGRCAGVVTYCLNKQSNSRLFPLAAGLFRAAAGLRPLPRARALQ